MSWTQAACDDCWQAKQPGRTPHRIIESERDTEVCSYCGRQTRSGIYMRDNPAEVPFPRKPDQ